MWEKNEEPNKSCSACWESQTAGRDRTKDAQGAWRACTCPSFHGGPLPSGKEPLRVSGGLGLLSMQLPGVLSQPPWACLELTQWALLTPHAIHRGRRGQG